MGQETGVDCQEGGWVGGGSGWSGVGEWSEWMEHRSAIERQCLIRVN